MLVDTGSVRATTDSGIATLWLDFPGRPANALNPARLAEIERAFDAVGRERCVEALVIRSARPAGFCGGYEPIGLSTLVNDADAAAYAHCGQRLFNRIAEAEIATVAFLEGPCLGPGWELALACDYRLAVAGPDSWIGFPNAPHLPPGWGGAARLGRSFPPFANGQMLTAKEVLRRGWIDDAFSARRAKVELQNWLDRIVAKPRKKSRARSGEALAIERIAFRTAIRNEGHRKLAANPSAVGTSLNDPSDVVELAIRGQCVVGNCIEADVVEFLAVALRRGRVTPLEAEQARKRIAFATNDESITSISFPAPSASIARAA